MSDFKVGEIVVGQNAEIELQYNGMEGEITGALQHREWTRPSYGQTSGITYFVMWADGRARCTWPWQMRRKNQPSVKREETGEWELCPWQPKHVTVKETHEQ